MHKTWRISAWIGGIYALLVLGITVYLGYNRPVVIAEASSGPGIRQETATNMTVVSEKAEISLQKDATGERSVYIHHYSVLLFILKALFSPMRRSSFAPTKQASSREKTFASTEE